MTHALGWALVGWVGVSTVFINCIRFIKLSFKERMTVLFGSTIIALIIFCFLI